MSIIQFWFSEDNSKKWFQQDKNFDNIIYQNFNKLLESKRIQYTDNKDNKDTFSKNELLEDIILFDQISRNIYRIDNHSFRQIDDEIGLKLAYYYINKYGIDNLQQQYFYFIILPLRHTQKEYDCTNAIIFINKYEYINKIIDENIWLNFKCASYRSYYNVTSQNIIDKNTQYFKDIDTFISHSIILYEDIIDPCIKNNNNFINTNLEKSIIYKEIEKSLTRNSAVFHKAYCISLSGGVDSMCIAHVLSCLGKKYNFKIHAVHIKYSNRDESDKEADLIKEFCFQLDIIYHQIDITHIKRGEINRSFYETETRRIRFDFYLNIKKHYGIELFALGHHRGDIAENVLTNLIKGRTLLDLPVMQEFETQNNVTLWRPLLNLPKSDILTYALEYGIIYTKNSTPEWSVRGKMRNIVFPQLNDMFNMVEINLYNAGLESNDLFEYINKNVVDTIFKNTVYGKLGFYFPIDKLKDTNFTIWKLVLQKIFHNIGLNMLKDHIVREVMTCEKQIINPCKNYICYSDLNKIIFLDTRYFNLIKSHSIKLSNIKSSINIKITLSDLTKDDLTKDDLTKDDLIKENEFELYDLIMGNVHYSIYTEDNIFTDNISREDISTDIIDKLTISNKLPKYMKQQFNKILPTNILNNYVWIFNKNQKGTKKYNIEILYL